jgi:hypothetical protein
MEPFLAEGVSLDLLTLHRAFPAGWAAAAPWEQRMKPAEADLPSTNGPEPAHPVEDGEEAMPLPADPKIIFLGGMFLILLFGGALCSCGDRVAPCLRFHAFAAAQSPAALSDKAAHSARTLRPVASCHDPGSGCGIGNRNIWSCRKLGCEAARWPAAPIPTPQVSRGAFRYGSAFLATDRGLCRME